MGTGRSGDWEGNGMSDCGGDLNGEPGGVIDSFLTACEYVGGEVDCVPGIKLGFGMFGMRTPVGGSSSASSGSVEHRHFPDLFKFYFFISTCTS